MKNFLNIFFVTLGVIFFIIILVGVFLYAMDSLNLFGDDASQASDDSGGGHPLLSESQEKALETFGIDPASVPSEITPEQEACFESKLGEERVAEIKAGDSPTMSEYLKAKDCI